MIMMQAKALQLMEHPLDTYRDTASQILIEILRQRMANDVMAGRFQDCGVAASQDASNTTQHFFDGTSVQGSVLSKKGVQAKEDW